MTELYINMMSLYIGCWFELLYRSYTNCSPLDYFSPSSPSVYPACLYSCIDSVLMLVHIMSGKPCCHDTHDCTTHVPCIWHQHDVIIIYRMLVHVAVSTLTDGWWCSETPDSQDSDNKGNIWLCRRGCDVSCMASCVDTIMIPSLELRLSGLSHGFGVSSKVVTTNSRWKGWVPSLVYTCICHLHKSLYCKLWTLQGGQHSTVRRQGSVSFAPLCSVEKKVAADSKEAMQFLKSHPDKNEGDEEGTLSTATIGHSNTSVVSRATARSSVAR